MKPANILLVILSALLISGCATTEQNARKGAQSPGQPKSPVSPRVVALVDPPDDTRPRQIAANADRIVVPACYRMVIIDGQQTLVRESDEQAIQGNRGSLRVVKGEVARGEISYQPGLIEQELAEEVVRTRQAQAQTDEAAVELTKQSEELMKQSKLMQTQNKILATQLAQLAMYARRLEEQLAAEQEQQQQAQSKTNQQKEPKENAGK